MPKVSISVESQETLDMAVSAICLANNYSSETGITAADFASKQMKSWLGEQIRRGSQIAARLKVEAEQKQLEEALAKLSETTKIEFAE